MCVLREVVILWINPMSPLTKGDEISVNKYPFLDGLIHFLNDYLPKHHSKVAGSHLILLLPLSHSIQQEEDVLE